MAMKLLIVGLPRSATTFTYKIACELYPHAMHFLEPFNPEPVRWALEKGQVIHDTQGPVPSDFNKLTPSEQRVILENATWLDEWVKARYPLRAWMGESWIEVLSILFRFRDVVVKDVVAWTRLEAILNNHPDVIVVAVKPDLDWWLERIRHYYDKRRDTFQNPLHKGGISLFYRFYNGGDYLDSTSLDAALTEAVDVHKKYLGLIASLQRKHDIRLLEVKGRVREDDVRRVLA